MKNIKITKISSAEIKQTLNEDLVLENSKLKYPIRKAFNIMKEPENVTIWFLDTRNADFKKEGIIIRFRYTEGYPLEITYKKRYSLSNIDEVEGLELAFKDNIYKDKFTSELDYTHSKKTLSFSHNEYFKLYSDYLSLEEAKDYVYKTIPNAFNHYKHKNYGIELLQSCMLYGPINTSKYSGIWENQDIAIEHWSGYISLIELSFHVPYSHSNKYHAMIESYLKSLNIYSPYECLKTDAVFSM